MTPPICILCGRYRRMTKPGTWDCDCPPVEAARRATLTWRERAVVAAIGLGMGTLLLGFLLLFYWAMSPR